MTVVAKSNSAPRSRLWVLGVWRSLIRRPGSMRDISLPCQIAFGNYVAYVAPHVMRIRIVRQLALFHGGSRHLSLSSTGLNRHHRNQLGQSFRPR
jgi:hypothetical protein